MWSWNHRNIYYWQLLAVTFEKFVLSGNSFCVCLYGFFHLVLYWKFKFKISKGWSSNSNIHFVTTFNYQNATYGNVDVHIGSCTRILCGKISKRFQLLDISTKCSVCKDIQFWLIRICSCKVLAYVLL